MSGVDERTTVRPPRAAAGSAADVDVQGIVPTFVAPWPLPGRSWIDLAVVFVLAALGLLGFGAALSGTGFLLAGLGGLALGMAVGVASHALRLNALLTGLSTVLVFYVFGSALAMPSVATFAVLPNLRTLGGISIGAVFGWKDFVTLQTPLSAPAYIMTLPYVAGLLVGVVSAVLAVRWLPRRPQVAVRCAIVLVGPTVLYALGVLLGTQTPFLAAVRGIAFALIALLWLGWRPGAGRGENAAASTTAVLRRKKIIGTAVLAAVAVVVGGGAAVVASPPADSRFVLREVVTPPFDPLEYPSPLAGFREYTKDLAETKLFTATGLEPGDRIRLAAMDSYDGRLWTVSGPSTATDGSGAFELVGDHLPGPQLMTPGSDRRVSIDITGYDDIWVPSVGYPSALTLDGKAAERSEDIRYNAESGAAVITSGIGTGDDYEERTTTQAVPSDTALATTPTAAVELPPVTNIPDIVVAKASEFVGTETTPMGQLRAIEQTLRTTGFLSHGLASDSSPSRAGHGADRMSELFTRTPMVGDEEQYASAFALMARSLGYPARVVMGFAPEVTEGQGSVQVVGDDVTAWVEVPFEGYGWVAFSPTPDETEIPQDQDPKPKTEPQPQVRQPPRSDNLDDSLLTEASIDDGDDKDKNDGLVIPEWVWWLALIVGVPVSLYVIPLLAISGAKRRRTKRRRAGGGDRSAAGAWDELIDRYAELGYTVPAAATRSTTASALGAQEPEGATTLTALAGTTDDVVFSGRDVDDTTADELWQRSEAEASRAQGALGWFARQRSRFRYRAKRSLVSRLQPSGSLARRAARDQRATGGR
ncbi:transglutaminase domain-containing protein [Plantibacter sp. CFBP 8775]|uniref:transglutaminase domain-containing protein n=1 Tax=Plantibacter sp. CFBP 8775 TaxID=2774038 RepID=UPI0017800185|nr:transglutaminase domain-containing protein [Plantibacter sp. CFBP 8775]